MILYHGTNADFDRISLTVDHSHEEAAHLLQDKYLDQQYYFGTERAVRFLRKTNAETV